MYIHSHICNLHFGIQGGQLGALEASGTHQARSVREAHVALEIRRRSTRELLQSWKGDGLKEDVGSKISKILGTFFGSPYKKDHSAS